MLGIDLSGFVASSTAIIGNFIGDFMPVILIIFAIFIGIIILENIVSLFIRPKEPFTKGGVYKSGNTYDNNDDDDF
jgi:hypothetical protein